MDLLRELVSETAAAGSISASAFAGAREPIGFNHSDQKEKRRKKINTDKKRKSKHHMKKRKLFSFSEGADKKETFDIADVVSKLKTAAKSSVRDQDAIAFGLEDENGQIIRVYVRDDQAEDFEKALESRLSQDNDEEDGDQNSSTEIAEVLFELKDKFDIIDVEWPTISEDEEEDQTIEDGEDKDKSEEDDLDALDDEMEDDKDDEGDEDEMAADEDISTGEEDVKSALTQVIDMMKADAEARKAEANAKKSEAESKIAGFNAQAANAKIKQEEEILDMESYYSKKSEEGKESKRLAKLAQYKHDVDADTEETDTNPASEDEEETGNEISKEKLLQLLLKHASAN